MFNIFPPGSKLAGRYRVLRSVASEGASALYEAESLPGQERVALKWLRLYEGHPAFSSGFDLLSTLRAVRELRHPSVLAVREAERQGNSVFVVTDLLRGEAFSGRLAPGRMPRTALLRFLLDALHAVAAAHARGLVHGGIHPENIVVVPSGGGGAERAIVTDFVTAHVAALGRPATKLPLRRALYRDGEQLESGNELDPRADVYAFAVIVHQALTGELPPGAQHAGAFAAGSRRTELTLARRLSLTAPARLQRALSAALGERRDSRPETLDELIESVAALSEDGQREPSPAQTRAGTALWTARAVARAAVEQRPIVGVAAAAAVSTAQRGQEADQGGLGPGCGLLRPAARTRDATTDEASSPRSGWRLPDRFRHVRYGISALVVLASALGLATGIGEDAATRRSVARAIGHAEREGLGTDPSPGREPSTREPSMREPPAQQLSAQEPSAREPLAQDLSAREPPDARLRKDSRECGSRCSDSVAPEQRVRARRAASKSRERPQGDPRHASPRHFQAGSEASKTPATSPYRAGPPPMVDEFL